MDASVSVRQLDELSRGALTPLVVDVRRHEPYAKAGSVVPGAIRRDPDRVDVWWRRLDLARPIVVYCDHGQEVSQGAARALRERGLPARYLEGGIAGWREMGKAIAPKPAGRTVWVTRERPKIDRIACPWLIRRFVDPDAEFIYVPGGDVLRVAAETGATPYDVPGVEFSHVGERCSFDAFVSRYGLTDPALLQVAEAVRGADTDRLDLAGPAAGLFAISLGLSANIPDDHEMLRFGLVVYDALYRWHRDGRAEKHNWPPVKAA